jgi:hypothetical protein
MCILEKKPRGYQLNPASTDLDVTHGQGNPGDYITYTMTNFVTFDTIKPKCIDGFCQQTNPDTGACTKKVAVICPSNESEFTFTGCDENRCMLNPKLPSTTKDRYVVAGCPAITDYVAGSSCRVRCKPATPSYNNTNAPEVVDGRAEEKVVRLMCGVHKNIFTAEGCHIKCSVPLSVPGAQVTYDGVIFDAKGFDFLKAMLEFSNQFLPSPYWQVFQNGSATWGVRLIGYLNVDFQFGGKMVSSLDAMDFMYLRFSEGDAPQRPAFVVRYKPTSMAVYDVRNCDTSMGPVWIESWYRHVCDVKCAPGFNNDTIPGWKPASFTCNSHDTPLVLEGCEFHTSQLGRIPAPSPGRMERLLLTARDESFSLRRGSVQEYSP